jgi:hypothetical protein
MFVTLEEKVSQGFWWVVTLIVTTYLALGIVSTLVVILK